MGGVLRIAGPEPRASPWTIFGVALIGHTIGYASLLTLLTHQRPWCATPTCLFRPCVRRV
ncbi:hypothetical protein FOA52_008274 [Chlamydomonas sp. UWO 241]|nr:hypothetical protein FOA52_008274 [Chlamydomonas sp. UWO 241]